MNGLKFFCWSWRLSWWYIMLFCGAWCMLSLWWTRLRCCWFWWSWHLCSFPFLLSLSLSFLFSCSVFLLLLVILFTKTRILLVRDHIHKFFPQPSLQQMLTLKDAIDSSRKDQPPHVFLASFLLKNSKIQNLWVDHLSHINSNPMKHFVDETSSVSWYCILVRRRHPIVRWLNHKSSLARILGASS